MKHLFHVKQEEPVGRMMKWILRLALALLAVVERHFGEQTLKSAGVGVLSQTVF